MSDYKWFEGQRVACLEYGLGKIHIIDDDGTLGVLFGGSIKPFWYEQNGTAMAYGNNDKLNLWDMSV